MVFPGADFFPPFFQVFLPIFLGTYIGNGGLSLTNKRRGWVGVGKHSTGSVSQLVHVALFVIQMDR